MNVWRSSQATDAKKQKVAYGKGPRMFPEVQDADQFAKQVQSPCNNLDGNALPVSAFVPGGRVPCGTSQYEKRGIAINVPKVDMDKCTQCNKCSLICPHAAVRPFLATGQELAKAPAAFKDGSRSAIGGGVLDNYQYRIQVSPWDCAGCELCVRICPADALTLGPAEKVIQEEEANWNFAVTLPDRGDEIDKTTVKGSQFQKPYLEFSGACEGCGETPHVKLMTQLFGDRLVIANATGHYQTNCGIFEVVCSCDLSYPFMPFSVFWQAAPPSGVAPIRPSPTQPTPRARALPGPTRSSKTTLNSASACERRGLLGDHQGWMTHVFAKWLSYGLC